MAKKRNRKKIFICLQQDENDFFIKKVLNKLEPQEREEVPLCLRYFVFGIMVEDDGFLKIEVYPKPAPHDWIRPSEKPILSIKFDSSPGILAPKGALVPVERLDEFENILAHKITEEFLAKNGTLTFKAEFGRFYVTIEAGDYYSSEVSLTAEELKPLCLKPAT